MDNVHLVIEKSLRRLTVYKNGQSVKQFQIVLGRSPVGPKETRGDRRTPEGEYYICTRNEQSKYHLFLGLSFPNKDDAQKARDQGRIPEETFDKIVERLNLGLRPPWDTELGGEVGIHGHGTDKDWTAGCIAVANEAIEELWEICPLGTQVHIRP
jgi:murein L,D-transpeptidase YafK